MLGNLEDPTVTGNIELLTDGKGKAALDAFLKDRALPDASSSTAFVKALQEVLSGLQKVMLKKDELLTRALCEVACRAPSANFVTGSTRISPS